MTELTNQVKQHFNDPTEDSLHDVYHELARTKQFQYNGDENNPGWQRELAMINADPSIQALLPAGFAIVGTEGDTSGFVPDPTQNGRIVLKNQTGEKEYINNNGTITNEKGQVIVVMYGQGATKQFSYDESGRVSQVVDKGPNGATTWAKGEDGKWHGTDQSGQPLKGPDGKPFGSNADISIDTASGDYRISYPNGDKEAYHQDGSSEVVGADGSKQSRDPQGRVTELVDAKGRVTKFDYNDVGKEPLKVTVNPGQKDEVIFERQKDSSYTQKQKGQPDRKGLGMTFGADGEMSVMDNASHTSQTFRRDGSVISQDGNKNISSIKYADGSERKFSYNADGSELTGVSDAGEEWSRDRAEWVNKQTGERASKMDIDKNGNFIVTDMNGNTAYHYSNGDTTTTMQDGAYVTTASNGTVKELHGSNGDTWRIDPSGESWSLYAADGKPMEVQTHSSPKVAANGDVTVSSGDGASVRYNHDGSIVRTAGDAVQIEQADGSKTTLQLNEKGEATIVVINDRQFELQDDGSWIDVETQAPMGISVVTVDDTGTVFVKQAEGTELRLPNGQIKWVPAAAAALPAS